MQLNQAEFCAQPPRLAVDIEGITLNPALRELVAKVKRRTTRTSTGIRVGSSRPAGAPGAGPEAAHRAPGVHAATVAAYQHRLVLDLYPAQEDPLEALIAERCRSPAQRHPAQPGTA
jgi:N-acetylmuramoyl-L-alanine amidase